MASNTMNRISSRWWAFLVRGPVALAIAACAFVLPGATAGALVYLFGAYFIISGLVALAVGFSFSGSGYWWLLIFSGIVQVLLGML